MADPTRARAELVPYAPEFASTVRSWIDSDETYHFVCRGSGFPPPEDVVDSWQRQGVNSYVLTADRQPVAYAELWDRANEQAVEIAHVLVAPFRRGEGFGTRMVKLLTGKVENRADISKLLAILYTDNETALACLLGAGFELVGTTNYAQGLRLVRIIR